MLPLVPPEHETFDKTSLISNGLTFTVKRKVGIFALQEFNEALLLVEIGVTSYVTVCS